MILYQWYVVLESNEVGNHPVGSTRLGDKPVVQRDPYHLQSVGQKRVVLVDLDQHTDPYIVKTASEPIHVNSDLEF